MIMDHEVKFNEGENSLRKKKHFSTNKENTLGLRSLTMVAIDPSPSLLLFFFRQNSLHLRLKIRKDAKFELDWLKTNEDLASKSHRISNFKFSGSRCSSCRFLSL